MVDIELEGSKNWGITQSRVINQGILEVSPLSSKHKEDEARNKFMDDLIKPTKKKKHQNRGVHSHFDRSFILN